MKTLDQIAEAAGVTKAAIYKRFQSYGLSVNELKAEKQGRAKVYGEDIERLIILMFQPTKEVESLVESSADSADSELEEKINRLEVERNEEKAGKERAEERAAAAEARAERAEAQTEMLLSQIDKLTDAIRAAEAIQAAQLTQIARLPTPEAKNTKPGFFERLRARLKAGKQTKETAFDATSARGDTGKTIYEAEKDTENGGVTGDE